MARHDQIEARKLLALAGIVVAHALGVALWLNLGLASKRVTVPRSIATYDVVSEIPNPVEPATAPAFTPVAIETIAEAPVVEIVERAVPAPVAMVEDPYAGAAVPRRFEAVVDPRTASAGVTVGQGDPAAAAASRAWIEPVRQMFRERLVQLGSRLRPVTIEVYARPSGGFTDARMRAGSGTSEIDRALLAAALSRQALVPPGLVATPRWIALPLISLADGPAAPS